MARPKGTVPVMSTADAARMFGLTWNQAEYLIRRKFHLQPVAVQQSRDKRCTWYRQADILRIMQGANLQRAS